MRFHNRKALHLLALLPAAALTACASGDRAVRETVEAPARIVGQGIKDIEKGVRDLSRGGIGETVGRLLTDRNRDALLREHRELKAHLIRVDRRIKRLEIPIRTGLLTDASDQLAVAGKHLEAPRILFGKGVEINKQLDSVRETFDLLSKEYPVPPFTGFNADI